MVGNFVATPGIKLTVIKDRNEKIAQKIITNVLSFRNSLKGRQLYNNVTKLAVTDIIIEVMI